MVLSSSPSRSTRNSSLYTTTSSLLRIPQAHCTSHQLSIRNSQIRLYSGAPPLTKEIITERIIELLESYDKVKQGAIVDANSSFHKDLGLDSFDTVEVIMEIEYEFSIIIPDNDADAIKTVGQAVEYIASQPDAC